MSSSQSLGATDATISVVIPATTATAYSGITTITKIGVSYSQGDIIVISGVQLGGAAVTNDLTITVNTVNANGGILTATFGGTSASIAAITYTINLPSNVSFNYYYTRDASDITRNIKERIIYNEKKASSPINAGKGGSLVPGRPGVNPGAKNNIPAGNAEMLWIPQGNQYRLSYLFGKLKCGGTNTIAGAFNLNGPIQQS